MMMQPKCFPLLLALCWGGCSPIHSDSWLAPLAVQRKISPTTLHARNSAKCANMQFSFDLVNWTAKVVGSSKIYEEEEKKSTESVF
jgi:hypothetical protein